MTSWGSTSNAVKWMGASPFLSTRRRTSRRRSMQSLSRSLQALRWRSPFWSSIILASLMPALKLLLQATKLQKWRLRQLVRSPEIQGLKGRSTTGGRVRFRCPQCPMGAAYPVAAPRGPQLAQRVAGQTNRAKRAQA